MTMTSENPPPDSDLTLDEFLPFRLEPTFAQRVWGRPDLSPWYPSTGTDALVGEVWLTGADCLIATGELKGQRLDQAIAPFPLLVKMLFPADKLSVQVHPDDEQAQAHGHDRGKTECWYVLDAVPGATVACGLKHGVQVADLESSITSGTTEDLMEQLPVVAGDMIFVDAGTVHAIGAGVTLLEVQQSSDVTYRLYDYGRDRELHLKKGLEVVKTKTAAGKVKPKEMDGFTRLVESEYFIIDLWSIRPADAFEMPMDGIGCVVALTGAAAVNEVEFSAGQAVVVPVGSVTMTSRAGATFVRCWAPLKELNRE